MPQNGARTTRSGLGCGRQHAPGRLRRNRSPPPRSAGRKSFGPDAPAGPSPDLILGRKLLLIHGDMDDNVHVANTLRVVAALIKEDKDFDMLIVPDADHGVASLPQIIRRIWDYFVRNLAGKEPPVGFHVSSTSTW